MQELKVGTLLQGGKYRIQEMLGQGGFGITYRAAMQSSATGKLGSMVVKIPVVVKEFFIKDFCVRVADSTHVSVPTTGSKEQTERYRQKFVKEARNISSLSHPNIVQVVDVFEENGTVYYVMQYLEGGSLRTKMERRGPLPEAEAVGYVRQIASALDYMHREKHLCHLDVKPSNIMLNEEGQAMLIDFGISKSYDERGNETSSTPVGISKGYAPIEQYQNSLHDFSPQTDIYSLGATLYALLVGQAPPEAALAMETGLGPQPQGVSQRTWQAVVEAMRPLRKDRPQTVGAFLDILDNGIATTEQEETEKVVRQSYEQTQPLDQQQPQGVRLPDFVEQAAGKSYPLKYVLIALVAAVLASGAFLLVKNALKDKPAETTATERDDDRATPAVENQYYESALGTGAYSGPVDSNGKPHGDGELKFTDKRVYRGPFVHGELEGDDCAFSYSNGDTYEGSFRRSQFHEGRYTVKASGDYFEGTFKDGQPDKGQWYDKDGKKSN